MSTTSARILALMHEQQLTQKRLAEHLQVSYSTLNNYLNGRRWPDLQMFRQLTCALNTSADYLLLLSDDPHPQLLCAEDQRLLEIYHSFSPATRHRMAEQLYTLKQPPTQ